MGAHSRHHSSLENYVALGGDQAMLEKQIGEASATAMRGRQEMDPIRRGLSLGARDVIEGLGAPLDFVAGLARVPMNMINGALGGDPNYFKPLFPALADSLGLARASTSSEKLLSVIQQGLISLPLAWWAGSAMLASKAASAAPSMTRAAGTMLTSGRAADVTSTVGSSAATVAAQASGAGPVATTIAGMAGGVGGGAVAGGKFKGGYGTGGNCSAWHRKSQRPDVRKPH